MEWKKPIRIGLGLLGATAVGTIPANVIASGRGCFVTPRTAYAQKAGPIPLCTQFSDPGNLPGTTATSGYVVGPGGLPYTHAVISGLFGGAQTEWSEFRQENIKAEEAHITFLFLR